VLSAVIFFTALPAAAQSGYDVSDELMSPELKSSEALILVSINDKDGVPIPGVVITVQQGFNMRSFSRVSDDRGRVLLIVPTRNTYKITFLSLTGVKDSHEERFDINGDEEQRYTLTMTYDSTQSRKFILEGVTFKTGSAVLKKSSYARLDPLVEYMKLKPEIFVELSGHTDNVGKPEDNLNLSEARAASVKAYLVKHGIDSKRVASTGYGDMRPVASNETAAGRKKNRRTEVKIID
jgi:outer membrane protein OmpA-like peptidoglycan-associated protein